MLKKMIHSDKLLKKWSITDTQPFPFLGKDGKYIGTITEGDLLWCLKSNDFPSLKQMEGIPITSINRPKG